MNFTYILKLAVETNIPDKMNLLDFKPFLESTDDIGLIHKLTDYEVSLSWQVISPGNAHFLGIMVDPKHLEPLGDFASYFNESTVIPYLATLLVKGKQHPSDKFLIPKTMELDNVVTQALATDDIFVIHERTSLRKKAVLQQIIQKLTGKTDDPAGITLADYKKRIHSQLKPDYHTAASIERIQVSFTNFTYTHEHALAVLENVYHLVVSIADPELLQELNRLTDELRASAANPDADISKLLKKVYALPRNAIMYEDNGDLVIKETITRLEKHIPKDIIKEELKALKKLTKSFNETDAWFNNLNDLRKKIMVKLIPDKNDFITAAQQDSIIDLLLRIGKNTQQLADNVYRDINNLLNDYIENVTQMDINRYINPDYYSTPFTYLGTTIVDTDTCLQEETLIKTMLQSKKVIISGSCLNGLYKMFLDAAMYQQQKDGQRRVYISGIGSEQPPKMAAFINQNFYGALNITETASANVKETGLPSFIWIADGSEMTWAEHVHESINRGLSVGIILFEHNNSKQISKTLREQGVKSVQVGTLPQLYGQVFDAVYLITDGTEEERQICAAMGMAAQSIIITGDYQKCKSQTALLKFYFLCAEDEILGRVYH